MSTLIAASTIALSFLLPLGFANSSTRYVRLGNSSAVGASGSHCGRTETSACASLALAVEFWYDIKDDDFLEIVLLPPAGHVNNRERLESVQNVFINGSTVSHFYVGAKDEVGSEGWTWLTLINSTNVTICCLNVWMKNGSAIEITSSSDVMVYSSIFENVYFKYNAVRVINSHPVIVRQCSFSGPASPEPVLPTMQYDMSAIGITLSCSQQPNCDAVSNTGTVCCLPSEKKVSIMGCKFERLGFLQDYSIHVVNHTCRSTALSVQIFNGKDWQVVIKNSSFINNTSPIDSTVNLAISNSDNCSVLVSGCLFLHNRAKSGGGLVGQFLAHSHNTLITVSRCEFTKNAAYEEGGALQFNFVREAGEVSRVEISECHITENKGGYIYPLVGGAISASSHFGDFYSRGIVPRIPIVDIRNVNFSGNVGSAGAAVFFSGIDARLVNIIAEHHRHGSVIEASLSVLHLSGWQLYRYNMGAYLGAVFELEDFSQLTIDDAAYVEFIGNKAITAGGVLYVDTTTSTPNLAELIDSRVDGYIGIDRGCPFLYNTSVTFSQSNVTQKQNQSIVIRDNFAELGDVAFANSFIKCRGGPLFPGVTTRRGMPQHTAAAIASGPTFVVFKAASCDCLKPLPLSTKTHLYYKHGCTRSEIVSNLTQLGYFNASTTQSAFMKEYYNYVLTSPVPSAYETMATVPEVTVLQVPWALSWWFWFSPRNPDQLYPELHQVQVSDQEEKISWVSNLTLYPAPGEEFTLEIEVTDFNLTIVQAVTRITALGNVLLRYGGQQYSRNTSVPFESSFPLTNIALAGVPGTTGNLLLEMKGQIRDNSRLLMSIPFRLRSCHLGYQSTDSMKNADEAQHYINTAETRHIDPAHTNKLICQCLSQKNGVMGCSKGRDVLIRSQYWGGDISASRWQPYNLLDRVKLIKDIFLLEMKLETADFETSTCFFGFCKQFSTSVTSYSLQTTNPCNEDLHRDGLACTSCQDGHSLTASVDFFCKKCSSSDVSRGRLIFSFISIITAAVAIFLMVVFHVGRSPTFQSWVFYTQVTVFLTRRTSSTLFFLIQVLTISASDLCLSTNLTPVEQLALQYIYPLSYFLILALISLLSRAFVMFRVWMARQEAVPAFWAVLTFSYVFVCYPTFFLLSCYKFNGRYVFYSDASMTCFGAEHLPYALLALFILCSVIIPLPLFLLFAREWPRIKPLIDVFLSFVGPKMGWWMAYDIIRRLLIVLIATYIDQVTLRVIILAGIMQLLFLLQFIIQPYQKREDNIFEAMLLANACLYATLNAQASKDISEVSLVVVFAWPTFAAIAFGAYKDRHRFAKFFLKVVECCKRQREQYDLTKEEMDEQELVTIQQTNGATAASKRTSAVFQRSQFRLREPLLFDVMTETYSNQEND